MYDEGQAQREGVILSILVVGCMASGMFVNDGQGFWMDWRMRR